MPAITKLTKSETLMKNEPEYFAKAVYEGLVDLDYHNYPYIACADNGDVYAIEGYSDGSGDWRAERFVVDDRTVDRSNAFRMIIAAKDAMQESPAFRTRKELFEALESGGVKWRDVRSRRARDVKELEDISRDSPSIEISVNLKDCSHSTAAFQKKGRGKESVKPRDGKPLSETPLGYMIALIAGVIAVQGFFFLSPLFLWLINWDTKRRPEKFPSGSQLESAKWIAWGCTGIALSALIRFAMSSS